MSSAALNSEMISPSGADREVVKLSCVPVMSDLAQLCCNSLSKHLDITE